MGRLVKRKSWPKVIAIVVAALIVNVLGFSSVVHSWAVPSSPLKRSRDVELERFLVHDMTSCRRNVLEAAGAVGLQLQASPSVVPALFIFGDSTVDVGNNNNLKTIARSTFWPYGKDFDTHMPTGRFCDGRLSVDFIANFLGLPLVPSFASRSNFAQGVNFASAGSGVLPDTGTIFGEYISFSEQLNNLRAVQQMMKAKLGASKSSKIISKSIYYISTGSNDFINNYLLPNSPHWQLGLDEFQQLVVATFTEQIRSSPADGSEIFQSGNRHVKRGFISFVPGAKANVTSEFAQKEPSTNQVAPRIQVCPFTVKTSGGCNCQPIERLTPCFQTLFKMGARKIVVVSLSPLGCLPSQLYKMGSTQGECIVGLNDIAVDYNQRLADRLHSLRHLPGVKLVYNDAYLTFRNITDNAASYGILHTNESCCGSGPYGGMKSCLTWSTTCQNASNHLWWDEFHPTAIAYKLIADTFWSGSIKVSSPWNVKTLASL